ncbi:MAG: hypothetical protein QNK23_14665 [Crocinitomicaceae bacterium]|nr:hypothetical protein [Crocinitomicaceae bacterium]
MLVNNFIESCSQYENFQIWDIESMDDFLNGNGVISEVFQVDYKMPPSEFNARREEIPQTNMEIMKNLLDQVGDKHFLIFTLHDQNHQELVHMQDTKVMNFGINISKIDGDHVYVVIMDKVA